MELDKIIANLKKGRKDAGMIPTEEYTQTLDSAVKTLKRIKSQRQDIFERIEKVSRVIDWEEDLGKMREFKEADYQALKKELGCV